MNQVNNIYRTLHKMEKHALSQAALTLTARMKSVMTSKSFVMLT